MLYERCVLYIGRWYAKLVEQVLSSHALPLPSHGDSTCERAISPAECRVMSELHAMVEQVAPPVGLPTRATVLGADCAEPLAAWPAGLSLAGSGRSVVDRRCPRPLGGAGAVAEGAVGSRWK